MTGALVARRCPPSPSSVTVIMDAAGRYFASFVVRGHRRAAPGDGLGGRHRPGADPLRGAVGRHEGRRAEVPAPGRRASCSAAAAGPVPQAEGQSEPQEGRRRRSPGRTPGWPTPGGTGCTSSPRRSSARTKRCTWRTCACPVSAATRLAKSVHDAGWSTFVGHAGVQGRPVRAHVRPGRPVVPVHPDVLGVRRPSATRCR